MKPKMKCIGFTASMTFPVLYNIPQIPAKGSAKLIRYVKMDKEGNYNLQSKPLEMTVE